MHALLVQAKLKKAAGYSALAGVRKGLSLYCGLNGEGRARQTGTGKDRSCSQESAL